MDKELKKKENKYNVYIDESGDEGILRGSNYFILTAIVVAKDKDLENAKVVDEIKNNLGLSQNTQLHWNKIKGKSKKLMIMNKISELDIDIINIVIDTRKIKFIPSSKLYYKFSVYLYERIIWLMESKNGVADISISSRSNLNKNNLLDYIKSSGIKNLKRINDFKIIPNQNRRFLQLADCCTSALGQALKYRDDAHYLYVKKISKKYYSYKGKYEGYGFKLGPHTRDIPKEVLDILNIINKKSE